MPCKHLLVHVDSTDGAGPRLELAAALARRHGARLVGLFAEADTLGPGIVGKRSPQQLEAAAARAEAAFRRAVSEAGVEADWWLVGAAGHADLVGLTAVCCRYVDLAVFGQHEEGGRVPPDLVEQVLPDCGRPLLVVPAGWRSRELGRRVVIGWNASPEAARALNDALPLLAGAEFVGVLAFQGAAVPGGAALRMPPADIGAHLALHGVRARVERAVQASEGIGPVEALWNYAFESQADLTVMGAGRHGFPLRHGATEAREILRALPTPLLLAR